ncbi:MAG: MBL fold metallo-hydrolase [Verrucomicrobiota bacterium]
MIEPVQKNEELLADFHEADNVTGAFHLWWLGHHGFLIKWNGIGVLVDPYLSDSITEGSAGIAAARRVSERVVNPLRLTGIEFVAITSDQSDRFDSETLMMLHSANPTLKVVAPAGIRARVESELEHADPAILPVNANSYAEAGAFKFHGINAARPKIRRDQQDNSLDLGYMISFGPFVIYQSGSTAWHTNLVKEARRWPINLALVSIGGDPEVAAGATELNGFQAGALSKAISATLAIPGGYGIFNDGVTSDDFADTCSKLGQRARIMEIGQRMTMGPISDPSAGKMPASQPYSESFNLGY